MWFKLVVVGENDLVLDYAGTDEHGEMPEWLSYHLDEDGLDYDMGEYGSEVGKRARWAMDEGIAPYQPFLIAMPPPTYHRTSWEYEEYDMEWAWWVKKIWPISDFSAARQWEYYFMERRRYLDAVARDKAYWDHVCKTRVDLMRVSWDYTHTYRDGWYPMDGGISMKLQSLARSRWGTQLIAVDLRPTGRHKATFEQALDALIEKTKEKLPHISEEAIRGLPVKQRLP